MGSVGCFVGAFALGLGAMSWVASPSAKSGEERLTAAPAADPREVSLVYDGNRAMDQYKCFHNVNGIMDAAKTAEVLFLGNSRMLCAFNREVLSEYFDGAGRAFYHLGFGYDEGSDFPLALIERFDLKPKVVVVGCDPSFWGDASEVASGVISGSRWEGGTALFEFDVAWRLRRAIHRFIPKVVSPEKIAIWRRHDDGLWVVRTRDPQRVGVQYHEGESGLPDDAVRFERATLFQSELERRGVKLILTVVPSNESRVSFARQAASMLAVPLIQPDPGLQFTTFDGDHLDEESSERFTHSFLEGFSRLDPMAP